MKTVPSVIAAFVTIAWSVRAEDVQTGITRATTAGPVATATSLSSVALLTPVATARIVGDIQDGTPARPQAHRPEFVASERDVLESKVHEQEGRTITVQKIKPVALPPPPAPLPRSSGEAVGTIAFKQQLADYRATHPGTGVISIGATVYRTHKVPPRTLVNYWPSRGDDPITFWSSANFALLSGIHSFLATDGRTYNFFMTWSTIDTGRADDLSGGMPLPDIPDFPMGSATFTIVGKPPADPSVLVPIQSLHDLYNSERLRLKTAFQGRERARLQQEADLKANPPQPKNIVLNYWTTDTPARAKKGGAK